MKKLLSLLLVLMLLCTGAFASDAMGDQFADCIIRLNDYLLNAENVEVDLDALKSDFDALGNYDGGTAALLSLYTQVLIDLRDVRYAECEAPLYLLNANAEKIVLTMMEYPDLYALGDIPTLEKYCQARMCEVQGDYAQAFALYGSIISFYDSMGRAIACYGRDSVAAPSQPTTTAAAATAAPQGTISLLAYTGTRAVNMSWTATSGLKNFKVYRRCDSRKTDWELISSTESKEYKDFQIVTDLYYTYCVEGVDAQGNVVRSNELQVFTKMNGGSGNTNTNTNTNTNQNSNSSSNKNNNTSSSSSSASSSSNNTNQNTNNVTQNVTVIIPTEKPVQWSAWSEWSTTPAYPSSTREVESMTRTEVGTEITFHYSRYRYIGKNGNNWYYPEYYRGDNYVRGGEWQYKTVDEPLNVTGKAAGETLYEGNWYHETMEETEVVLATWIEYRYRDRIN